MVKDKRVIIALVVLIITIIAGIILSFADNNYYELFSSKSATNQDAALYILTDAGLQQTAGINGNEFVEICNEYEAAPIDGYTAIKYNGVMFYIESACLQSPEEFQQYCIANGFLWARAKKGELLYQDASLSAPIMTTIINPDATGEDDFLLTTNDITFVQKDEVVSVMELTEHSAHITLANGNSGWISSEDLEFSISTVSQFVAVNEIVYDDVRTSLVKTALNYEGGRYVWGGQSLENGVDCSGFTMMLYAKYGVALSHSAETQSRQATHIDRSSLLPGDLVFYQGYKGRGGIGHVAIYIGNGQIIHALNKRVGILISDIDYDTPVAYGRVL